MSASDSGLCEMMRAADCHWQKKERERETFWEKMSRRRDAQSQVHQECKLQSDMVRLERGDQWGENHLLKCFFVLPCWSWKKDVLLLEIEIVSPTEELWGCCFLLVGRLNGVSVDGLLREQRKCKVGCISYSYFTFIALKSISLFLTHLLTYLTMLMSSSSICQLRRISHHFSLLLLSAAITIGVLLLFLITPLL